MIEFLIFMAVCWIIAGFFKGEGDTIMRYHYDMRMYGKPNFHFPVFKSERWRTIAFIHRNPILNWLYRFPLWMLRDGWHFSYWMFQTMIVLPFMVIVEINYSISVIYQFWVFSWIVGLSANASYHY